jgi:hypothetical protein
VTLKHAETDAELLARLGAAAERPVRADDLRRQRASYVLGNLADDDPATLDEVTAVLDQLDGEAG